MPRAPRPGRERRTPVEPETWLWLLDGERPVDSFEIWSLDAHGDKPNSPLRALWTDLGALVVATFAQHASRQTSTRVVASGSPCDAPTHRRPWRI
jgi:hypothetical protein